MNRTDFVFHSSGNPLVFSFSKAVASLSVCLILHCQFHSFHFHSALPATSTLSPLFLSHSFVCSQPHIKKPHSTCNYLFYLCAFIFTNSHHGLTGCLQTIHKRFRNTVVRWWILEPCFCHWCACFSLQFEKNLAISFSCTIYFLSLHFNTLELSVFVMGIIYCLRAFTCVVIRKWIEKWVANPSVYCVYHSEIRGVG